MSLDMINETFMIMGNSNHSFSDKKKEFVVQFAFKTEDRELVNKLMEDLMKSEDELQSEQIMQHYSAMYDIKPKWVEQVENLLVALEMYRIEEEKAMNHLADILGAYGIDVSIEEIREADAAELKTKLKKEAVL